MTGLPDPMRLTVTAENVDEIREAIDSLPALPDGFVWGLEIEASGEIVRPPHADECVQVHPNQPCPGYPHEETPQ